MDERVAAESTIKFTLAGTSREDGTNTTGAWRKTDLRRMKSGNSMAAA
jgi:hypothetical protein